jgi:hypothetical protein
MQIEQVVFQLQVIHRLMMEMELSIATVTEHMWLQRRREHNMD